ncbi:lipopolysaccharide heptosyltransferase II [Candidatus Thiodubiliella endoseptemdiera]|uniref:lipopolysaccharide heptosyltransferase II n=1 Tax=Candidatus Thiodubiliella endoseptemdiera TaxID=2738886 RepID=UPI0034DF96A8
MRKILIEIPTWLGDCVMATPAIENIIKQYPNIQITIFGSSVATEIFKYHPQVDRIVVDESRNKKYRIYYLYRLAKQLGRFDCALSFRRTITSKLFIFFTKASLKKKYRRYDKIPTHQVNRYNDFVNIALHKNNIASKLIIHTNSKPLKLDKKILGINPGASYGSAKRWYPDEFAKVASVLSAQYNIVIFGGNSEVDIASDIEKKLVDNGVKNYTNLAGKTSVSALIKQLSILDLFITGDSGPMHVAAAFQVPTVAIFGPTKDKETAQWMNQKSVIIKKNLECQPCMKRICPLKHHNCMKKIKANEVLDATVKILAQSNDKVCVR